MNSQPHFQEDDTGAIRFMFGDLEAGAYQVDDPFKPHIHPLRTPAGYKLSLDRPHDHPHHKALMFALETETHNYWEEYPLREGCKVGLQRPQDKPELEIDGTVLACRHSLHWMGEDDTEAQMIEERSIRCALDANGEAFTWTWQSVLTPIVDVQLAMSPYSPELEDGQRVNYHGLGIRLRREFGCTGGNEIRLDGEAMPVADALGKRAHSVGFVGSIDEIWPVPRCEVTFSSPESHGVFAMDTPFAYLAFGPSVLETPLWKSHEPRNCTFTIRVSDITPES